MLVGREDALARLHGAREDRGGLTLLVGDIGVGKSRLAESFALAARESGAAISCMSYGTSADALQVSVLLRAQELRPGTVLVLDDLHRADRASLELLRTLLPEIADAGALAIGTVDHHGREPLAALGGFGTDRPITVIRVGGLDGRSLASVAERVACRPLPEPLLTALAVRSAGNPLFIAELVRSIRAEGWLEDSEGAMVALATWGRLEEVIAHRVRRLAGTCRQLLVQAAQLQVHFDLQALRGRVERDTESFLDLVDEAEREGFLEPSPWHAGRYRFSHPLHREIAGGHERIARAS
jgi:predicted ATPase